MIEQWYKGAPKSVYHAILLCCLTVSSRSHEKGSSEERLPFKEYRNEKRKASDVND